MHRWLDIPGDPLISRILTCIFVIGLQVGIYILALLVLRHYVKQRADIKTFQAKVNVSLFDDRFPNGYQELEGKFVLMQKRKYALILKGSSFDYKIIASNRITLESINSREVNLGPSYNLAFLLLMPPYPSKALIDKRIPLEDAIFKVASAFKNLQI